MRWKAAALSLVLAVALGVPALAADFSGEWIFKAVSPTGDDPGQMTLTQSGPAVKGVLASERGRFKLEGTVKEEQIQFLLDYNSGDEPMRIPFTGRLSGNTITGEFHAGDFTGSWSAQRAR